MTNTRPTGRPRTLTDDDHLRHLESASKQMFRTLDVLRGAAALLVAVRHTANFFGPIPFFYSYLAVDLFFVISGFVLEQAYGNRLQAGLTVGRFLWFRIVRLYPLYVIGFFIATVVYFIDPTATIFTSELKNFVGAILFGALMLPTLSGSPLMMYPFNSPSWSLGLELAANAAYAYIHPILNKTAIILICAFSFIGLCAIARFGNKGLDYGWSLISLPMGLTRVTFSFFFGVGLYRFFRSRNPVGDRIWKSNACALLILSAAIFPMMLPRLPLPNGIPDLLAVGLLFPAVVYAGALFSPGAKLIGLFRLAGLTSYAVYALHVPLSVASEIALKSFGFEVSTHQPFSGVAFLVLLLVFCWWIDLVYDVPIRKGLSSLSFSALQCRFKQSNSVSLRSRE
jgi:peptidoglycan/LPS O-acetylase OafA/YrhL